jgi:hypothetical protein
MNILLKVEHEFRAIPIVIVVINTPHIIVAGYEPTNIIPPPKVLCERERERESKGERGRKRKRERERARARTHTHTHKQENELKMVWSPRGEGWGGGRARARENVSLVGKHERERARAKKNRQHAQEREGQIFTYPFGSAYGDLMSAVCSHVSISSLSFGLCSSDDSLGATLAMYAQAASAELLQSGGVLSMPAFPFPVVLLTPAPRLAWRRVVCFDAQAAAESGSGCKSGAT